MFQKYNINKRFYNCQQKGKRKMKIQPVQNNNTNFQGLHVDKKIYRQLGVGRGEGVFLHNSAIKECADRFEVLVKKGKPIKREKMDSMAAFIEQFSATSIGMAAGFGIGVILPMYTGTSVSLVQVLCMAMVGGVLGLAGAIGHIIKKNYGNDYEYILQVGKKIKDSTFGKKELVSPLSKKYSIKNYNDINNIKNIAEIAKQKDEQNFMDIIDYYNVNDLYDPKKFLDILQNKAIVQNFSSGECFNYKLQEDSNDTLLTKFFDIVPTEENKKDYDKIIKIIKNTENINYNQVDSNGISVIEKIINSENLEILDLVNDFEFNYSREMDFAYENIKDPKFRRKVKNLNIKFPNVEEAIKINSRTALQAVLPELKSPFCNITMILNNLLTEIPYGHFRYAIDFLRENDINISYIEFQGRRYDL